MRFQKSLVLIFVLFGISCHRDRSSPSPSLVSQTLSVTTNAQGVSEATYNPSSLLPQTITISEASAATKGTQIILQPGTLSVQTQLFVEEGVSPSATVVQSLSLPETPTAQSATVVIRPADVTVIPAAPLTLSIPISVGLGLNADQVIVALYLCWTKDGIKAGFIPPGQISIAGGLATFKSPYFGSFQLASITTVPAIVEAPSTRKIETKVEAAKPESLYAVGHQQDIAGFWKDDVWVALSTAEQGKSRAWKGLLSGLGDLYFFGIVNATGSRVFGEPGYWKNAVWTALPTPQSSGKCNAMDGVFSLNVLHVSANCENEVLYWVDGKLTQLPKASPEVGFQEISSFASDGQGNLSIVGAQTIPAASGQLSTVINGEWYNGVWKEFGRGDNTYLNFPYVGSVHYSESTKTFVYLGTNTDDNSKVSNFIIRNEVKSEIESDGQGIAIAIANGSEYITAVRNSSLGFLKDNVFTAYPTPPGFKEVSKSAAYDINISKSGDVFMLGNYSDWDVEPNESVTGVWKAGVWSEINRSGSGVSKNIYDIFLN